MPREDSEGCERRAGQPLLFPQLKGRRSSRVPDVWAGCTVATRQPPERGPNPQSAASCPYAFRRRDSLAIKWVVPTSQVILKMKRGEVNSRCICLLCPAMPWDNWVKWGVSAAALGLTFLLGKQWGWKLVRGLGPLGQRVLLRLLGPGSAGFKSCTFHLWDLRYSLPLQQVFLGINNGACMVSA